MSDVTLYLCYRPDTKSKAPHAKCRQYAHDTVESLMAWLLRRRNSTERIIVEVVRKGVTVETIEGRRFDLSARTEWPALRELTDA